MAVYWPDNMKVDPIGAWRAVLGFPAYEVSDRGDVRRVTPHRGKSAVDGVLKPSRQPNGYLAVNLYRDGRATRRTVHTLVYEAFVGSREGIEVNHIDGDKSNNALVNLEAATSAQNKAHAVRTGLAAVGARNAATKISQADVVSIRAASKAGVTQRAIARQFGVSQGHVSDIVRGRKRGVAL